jgi:small subunit ribosomal protein S20
MANTKSAEKRNRQNVVARDRNRAHRSRLRTAIKRLRTVVASGDGTQAAELLPTTLSIIDGIAQKKVIHANTASRYKSRLAAHVAAIGSGKAVAAAPKAKAKATASKAKGSKPAAKKKSTR